jgi:hypothetical protein
VDFEGRRFTVLEMSDHRISRVRVEPLENQVEEAKRGGTQNPGVGQTDLIKADVVARAQGQAGRKEG